MLRRLAFSDLLHESLNKPKMLSNILRSISTNREILREYSASEEITGWN
ncbi:16273_t:CDS:2 [Cetraspora pellucida]|uniref:16273_t:CDS:1 n=1 Tax=Cetraspora pellucida TaxID=1433469 RepID=A0A9N8ZZ99_9GLOM|nr:16273_t:CDS:2 [Cetraspora pellucida]